jgi:hypothetical protein
VVGPFVYLGHEKLWDYYGSPSERTLDPPTPTNYCQRLRNADRTRALCGLTSAPAGATR